MLKPTGQDESLNHMRYTEQGAAVWLNYSTPDSDTTNIIFDHLLSYTFQPYRFAVDLDLLLHALPVNTRNKERTTRRKLTPIHFNFVTKHRRHIRTPVTQTQPA